MDHDAMNRHVQNLLGFKTRAEKVVAFVEALIEKGGVNPDVDAKQSLVDDIAALRTDITKMQDTIEALDKFRDEVVPVLDQLPKFQEMMTQLEAAGPQLQKLAGVDFDKNEERLTAVEGKVEELDGELDQLVTSLDGADDTSTDTTTKEPISGSDGATPGPANQGDGTGAQPGAQSEGNVAGAAGASEGSVAPAADSASQAAPQGQQTAS